jgi:hypothetical protein
MSANDDKITKSVVLKTLAIDLGVPEAEADVEVASFEVVVRLDHRRGQLCLGHS